MKRIAWLMSALVTVLVLGVFAIARAQRGEKEPASDESPVSGPSLTAPVSPGRSPSAASQADEPRPLPRDPHINPLRKAKRAFSSNPIRATAATAEDQPVRPAVPSGVKSRSDSGEKTFPPRTIVSPAAPADPFQLRSNPPAGRLGNPEIGDAAPAPGMASKKGTMELRGPSPGGLLVQRSPTNDLAIQSPKQPELADAAAGPPAAPGNPSPSAGEPALLSPGSTAIPRVPRSGVESGRTLAPDPTRPPSPGPARPSSPEPPRSLQGPNGTAGRIANPSYERARLLGPLNAGQMRPSSPEPTRPFGPESTTTASDPIQGAEGSGKPGAKNLDGPQAPQITIQKIAPPEIQVGRPATFQIKLKNTGPVVAHGVELHDIVPKGTRLMSTSPQANPGVGARGELVWQIGTLKPADEVTIEVQLMPEEEGEIGSVATVSFSADASARTRATKPQLVLKVTAPPKVLIGEDVTLKITIMNVGSGVARKVVLDERVPPGLQHATGPELEYDVGDLKPNETRQLELKLTAVQPGPVSNVLVARGDQTERAQERCDLEVLAPQLELDVEGPKHRFLDREAVYTISVSNPGTAPARQVRLAAHLPPGLKFVRANNSGAFDDATRSVQWLLEELPVRDRGAVELVTVPVSIGEENLRVRGTAEKGIVAEKMQPVIIDGIAATMFEVADTRDPIEVNSETTYEIHVRNQGSKASANVQITVALPADLKFVAAEGPTRYAADGNAKRVVFEPLPRLAAKAETTYRVRVQGLKPGDQRVRVQLLTDEIREPLTKEESTQVYSDK